ncbi:MAG: 2-oxoglutarate dehydrogenase E1 component, partial [Nevskiales bacterium]
MSESDKLIDRFRASSALFGANGGFIEEFYEDFLKNPDSVAPSWREYFKTLRNGADTHEIAHSPIRSSFVDKGPRKASGAVLDQESASKQAGVLRLINYYRVRGHQAAELDPLGIAEKPEVPDLDPSFHGLGEMDMDRVFNTGSLAAESSMKLRDIEKLLQHVYTGTIGAEYMYITDTQQKRWVQRRMEGTAFQPRLSKEDRIETLRQLTAAEGIERYLHTRYVGQKRFSLEGGDSLIPLLDAVIGQACNHKTEEVVIGMAHRGRLNVLVNILGKSPQELFDEFEGKSMSGGISGSGDVKYHMGFSTDVDVNGHQCHLVLAFNPSHLEIVNPVVEGSVKARQYRRGDEEGERVLPILIHGDAAFAGQGVVMETMQLSQSQGYSTGGTVHVIVNNQIGFTTPNPIETEQKRNSRTSLYSTDLAKMLEAPVFHVNADDPEAVVFVSRMAMDFRREFNKDVIIDLICYRRHGHNEADEPAVTQPMMYQRIKKHPTTRELYAKRLVKEGLINDNDADLFVQEYRDGLDAGENKIRQTLGMVGNQYTADWSNNAEGGWDMQVDTRLSSDKVKAYAEQFTSLPKGFEVHPRVKRIIEDRRKMAAGALPMDWGFAETTAYASLIDAGYQVRITGQDVGRGTFFHRHAVMHNQKELGSHVPLQTIGQAKDFQVWDTLLSEEGVLGFEYGYSTAEPNALLVWEAQFGDFANGAQVVMDQFISSGQAKWGRYCGLTMFLPHGYEGQGPEHSSARLERYLQLCAENNMQV